MIQLRIAGLACALASLILISGPAALAQTPTPSATAPAQTDFTVAGVTFHMSLPDGYCFPFGRYVELARETAALDDRNMTDASFMKCDDMKKNVDPTSWGMLKTPLASIGKNVGTRAKLVAALGDLPLDGELHPGERQRGLGGSGGFLLGGHGWFSSGEGDDDPDVVREFPVPKHFGNIPEVLVPSVRA